MACLKWDDFPRAGFEHLRQFQISTSAFSKQRKLGRLFQCGLGFRGLGFRIEEFEFRECAKELWKGLKEYAYVV